MRAAALGFGLAALAALPPAAAQQRPTVSPRLERAARADSALVIWLFARPTAALRTVEDAVTRAGGRVRHASQWLHAVSAEVPARALEVLRTRTDLRHLQPVTVFRRDTTALTALTAQTGLPAPTAPTAAVDGPYGPSAMPLRRINLFPLVERGFRGTGVRIAILDTGFETGLPAFSSASVAAQRDFVFGDDIVRDEPQDQPGASRHGTQVWSLLAASVSDTMIGIAPNAQYLLAKTEDVRQEVTTEEDNFVAALEWAAAMGADIVSASLSYLTFDDGAGYVFGDLNGDIAVTTVAADAAAARGIVVLAAVGNGGSASRTLTTPADGDSVLAVGAEDSLGFLAGFSSRGPTADGRMKPDFTAPGVAVLVLTPQGGAQAYGRVDGTSFSTPVLAGAVALLREIHPTLSPAEVRAALRFTGTNRASPDSLVGWGRPDLFVSAIFPRGVTVTQPTGGGAIAAATPRVQWTASAVPAFAQPATFHLRLWSDTTRAMLLFDTTTTLATSATFPPLAPGATFTFELAATAADSARVVVSSRATYTIPPWVTLTTLNDPAGLTIRDATPLFAWQAAQVHPPFPAMTFDLRVLREDGDAVAVQALGLTETTFTPVNELEFNTPYRWQVTAHLAGDSVTVASAGTFVIVRDEVPAVTTLFQNFPNPFPNTSIGQHSTCLWFDLARQGNVSLEILDVRGHVVRRLIPAPDLGPFFTAGRYGRPPVGSVTQCDPRFSWDGTAGNGTTAPAGLYLAKLTTPDGNFFRRLVFLGGSP